ncbi:MAG TPA: tetratricopeptide repeat protein [Candidatus Dormibacteraeota bacterium]|nr:tetratricopeptide repeat protein [Candidatus Dormibacteraeota bacterium]
MGGSRSAALAGGLVLLCAVAPARAHVGTDELLAASRAAAAANPADADVQLQLARALRLAGDSDGALVALDAALAHGADADEVAATRAGVLLDAGQAAAAVAELDRLLARRPDAPGAHFDRGRACLALGRADDAARELGVAIATLPAPRPEQVLLHRDALLAQGRIADAVRALDAGMARLGTIAALQLPAVELELRLDRTDAALARLDALMARAGRNPFWLVRRAEILAGAGRGAEARAAYEEAGTVLAAHAGARRIHAFDALAERIAAALAATPPGGNDRCGLQSDAAWAP